MKSIRVLVAGAVAIAASAAMVLPATAATQAPAGTVRSLHYETGATSATFVPGRVGKVTTRLTLKGGAHAFAFKVVQTHRPKLIWTGVFVAPRGTILQQGATYTITGDIATRWQSARMVATSTGFVCGGLNAAASFTMNTFQLDLHGKITALDVTFSESCNGAPLSGEFKWNIPA